MPNSKRGLKLNAVLIFFFFSCFFGRAQSSEKITLLAALSTLESSFEVRFSYAADDVIGVSLVYEQQSTLESSLRWLEQKIPFKFNQINDRYITVVKNNKSLLCGTLLNAYTGIPIEDATVIATKGNFATVTNSEGIFYVPVSIASENLTIRFIGFEVLNIALSDLTTNCEPILIQQEYSDLETIYITKYLVQGLKREEDGSVRINTEKFGLLPGQVENDILQITQALPGIQSADESISNINIRGGTHDETLILWNDIKTYQSGHFFGLISAFNPNITKDVTIYKNGTPARYGEGVSGIIAMKSDDKLSDKFSGGIGLNLIDGGAFGSIPISEKLTLQVSGRSSINSLWETPVYSTYSEKIFQDTEITNDEVTSNGLNIASREEFNFYDFSGRLLWDVSEKDAIRANFLIIDNTLSFLETLTDTERSSSSNLEQKSIVAGLSWTRNWSSRLSTKILGYTSYYDLDALNRDILTNQEIFQDNEVLENGIKIDGDIILSDQIELKSGYQFNETGVSNIQDVNLPRFRDFKKEVLRTHSGFAGVDFGSANGKTNIMGGIRLNYYEKFSKLLFEPRLMLHQDLGKGLAIEAAGEFKSQTTTQRIDFESDFLGVEKRRWILADNDAIPIIESKQGSLGLSYESSDWLVNVEGFYKKVDGITASNQGFQNQYQYERKSGDYTANGIELVLNKRSDTFSGWLSYTFLNSTYSFDSFNPSEFSHNLEIKHSATLAGSYSFERLKIALGLNWHSGKPYTIPLIDDEIVGSVFSESIQYDLPNSQRLPDYFRADISAEYLLRLSSSLDAKINLAVLNVLDAENTLNIRYALINDSSGQTKLNKIEAFSLGLTPNFSIQVLF